MAEEEFHVIIIGGGKKQKRVFLRLLLSTYACLGITGLLIANGLKKVNTPWQP